MSNQNTNDVPNSKKKLKPVEKKKSQFYVHNEQTPAVQSLLLGQYYNIHDRQVHPVTARWVERMCQLMMDWANKETSLRITDFTDDKDIGLDPFSYYQFINQFSQMKIAHDYCMRRIATRREIGGLTNKFNTTMITRVQSHYDSTWALQEEKIAKMAKDMGGMNGNIKVVLQEFERLEGENAPTYVNSSEYTGQAEQYHVNLAEQTRMETLLLQEKALTMSTPEDVAMGIVRTTSESRQEGKGQYVAKSGVKRQIKAAEARVYDKD